MKKSLFAAGAFLLLLSMNTLAQNQDDKTWASFHIGAHEYRGDFENEFYSFKFVKDFTFGFGIHHYLNESFDLDYTFNFATLDDDDPTHFWTTTLNNNLQAKFKFANGSILETDSKIQPFLTAGLGLNAFIDGSVSIQPDQMENNVTVQIPLGFGFEIPINDDISFKYQSTYNRTFNDYVDGRKIDGNSGAFTDDREHDDLFFHTLGLKVNLFKTKDADGDGVRDSRDECPTEMGTAETNGCADSDGDMVADINDMCPDTFGLAEFSGCADTDADGISDIEDACPEIAGDSMFNGCADSDADGIADPEDACPQVAGDAQFAGCADSDGDMVADPEDNCPQVAGVPALGGCPDVDADGIIDSEDRCPAAEGSTENGGCPDTDGDGVVDLDDECPNEMGAAGNNGCPGISAEVQEELMRVFENLQFGNNSSDIATESLDDLEVLYQIMARDENLMLSIEGHTDSRGAAEYNLQLSQSRADAVKTYLVEKGIDASRITATGYGETQPVDTNETAEGRNNNRRVELNLDY